MKTTAKTQSAVVGFALSAESRPRAVANLLMMHCGDDLAKASNTAKEWAGANEDAGALDHAELYRRVGRLLFADSVKAWRADIRLCDRPDYRVALLCYAYNVATNPAALHDDDESRILRKFAAACRRELSRYAGWHESDNGRLWVHGPQSRKGAN